MLLLGSVNLHGHNGPIYGLSFSPDRSLLLSCSEDGTIRLWSLQTWTCLVNYKVNTFILYKITGLWSELWDIRRSDMLIVNWQIYIFTGASFSCMASKVFSSWTLFCKLWSWQNSKIMDYRTKLMLASIRRSFFGCWLRGLSPQF